MLVCADPPRLRRWEVPQTSRTKFFFQDKPLLSRPSNQIYGGSHPAQPEISAAFRRDEERFHPAKNRKKPHFHEVFPNGRGE